jgi:NAD(P)H-hydrate epimerase
VGKLAYVDFGLPKEQMLNATADFIMLSPSLLRPIMPQIVRNRHKYQAGHVVCLAGSHAMPGASMLAALSTICSGAGIVHLLYSEDMAPDLVAAPYELLKVPYKVSTPKPIVELMNSANATLIGPGLGRTPETHQLLSKVLPQLTKPCVLDADALSIIAEDSSIKLPAQCILTPHIGEMKRLLHITEAILTMEFLLRCQAFASDKNVTLVLKGGPSFMFHPREPILVSSRGDPGMATAGSGDVLTGLLASLMAQGMSTFDAVALGVYIHGVAGEYAAEELTSYCMTASDLITYFPDAFRPSKWSE